jgi:hypothetical protein
MMSGVQEGCLLDNSLERHVDQQRSLFLAEFQRVISIRGEEGLYYQSIRVTSPCRFISPSPESLEEATGSYRPYMSKFRSRPLFSAQVVVRKSSRAQYTWWRETN